MLRTRFFIALLATATFLLSACSSARAPGEWTYQDTETGDAFYSVNFVNEQVGWLNGQTDRSSIPVEENANGNANGNANTGLFKPGEEIVDPLKENQGFEVLQTTDGGQTWRQIPDQFKNKVRSVWFVDPQQGWALTIDRDILRTRDGGLTWALQRKAGTIKLKLIGNLRDPVIDQPEQIDHIYFIDGARGWAWGGGRKDEYTEQPGVFLTTIDGGEHWNQVPYPFEQDASTIFFLDAKHAWASTNDGGFYKTEDGGLNWTRLETKLPELVCRSIFFTDENTGWIVGRSGRIAKTEDGGRTWKKMYKIKDEFVVRDIFFTDRNQGWAVGDKGVILYTPDGGDSWAGAGAPVAAQLIDVSFVNEHVGWAVGLGGAVLRHDLK
ncbi:MAG: YCF48-related protein [Blastocatellia bacterium]|nr:YCF48-related protein [Blastocatellia bacterium]